MSDATSNKFIALYSIPQTVMADWHKTDEGERKAAEEKMKAEWDKWTADHSKMIHLTAACGKTKRVTSDGTTDAKNDICLYTIIEAESLEAAAKAFEQHPHLQIPQASIDVMPVRKI